MRSATLFMAGSWAVALLLGFFIWVSPDSGFYPSSTAAAIVTGLAFLLWLVGAFATGFPRSAPKLSFGVQVGAAAPVIAGAVALVLAGRGVLPHPALPLLVIILGGAAGWWWGRRAPAGPTSAMQEMAIVLTLIPVILVVIPALLLAIWGQQLWSISTPNYAAVIERFEAVDAFASYRPAPREGITPTAAGRALLAISYTGDTNRSPYLMAIPAALDRRWLPDSGPFRGRSADSVMMKALAGLSAEERSWLTTATAHPSLPLLDTVAYARQLEPWAGLVLPLPELMNAYGLPYLRALPVRRAARLQLYRAALAAADRRPAVADSLVREVIGFGVRLRDDADQLVMAMVGASIVREAGATLAQLRRGTGRKGEGDSLVALAARKPTSDVGSTPALPDRPLEIRRQMIAAITSAGAPRPVQWELASLLGAGACTDLRELLFGPTSEVRAAFDAVRPAGRGPEAEAAFEVLQRGITADSTVTTPPVLWLADLALGHRTAAPCIGLVAMM